MRTWQVFLFVSGAHCRNDMLFVLLSVTRLNVIASVIFNNCRFLCWKLRPPNISFAHWSLLKLCQDFLFCGARFAQTVVLNKLSCANFDKCAQRSGPHIAFKIARDGTKCEEKRANVDDNVGDKLSSYRMLFEDDEKGAFPFWYLTKVNRVFRENDATLSLAKGREKVRKVFKADFLSQVLSITCRVFTAQ